MGNIPKIPTDDKEKWRYFYKKLRHSIVKSDWRKSVLFRDKYKCVRCDSTAKLTHHVVRLSFIISSVFKENPNIHLFDSHENMKNIIKLVIDKHKIEYGMSLCYGCHRKIHRIEYYKTSVYNIFRDGIVNCENYQRKDKNYVKCKNYFTKTGVCSFSKSYDSLCIELYDLLLKNYESLINVKE